MGNQPYGFYLKVVTTQT